MSVTTTPTTEKKLGFIDTLSGGVYKLVGGKKGQDAPVQMVSHEIQIDISGDLKSKLKFDQSPHKDWWDDLMSHLPPCEIVVKITAEAKVWEIIESNWEWETKVTYGLFERVSAGIGPVSTQLLRTLIFAENEIPPLSDNPTPKVQKAIDGIWDRCREDCSAVLNDFGAKVARETADEMRGLISELKEVKGAVKKYRFVAGARVVKNIALIAGNIAHVAASWGGTSPLAIISIARSCVEIGHIVGKGLMDADLMGGWVKFDLAAIELLYTDDKDAGKAQNNAAEIVLNAVSGVLNAEVPSVKNCKTHIGDFDHKVHLLQIDHAEMGTRLAKLGQAMNALHGKIDAAKRTGASIRIHKTLSNDDAIKKLQGLIDEMNKGFTKLFDGLPEAGGVIKTHQTNAEGWRKTLEGYEKQTSGWTKHVTLLTSIATEAGLGMGHVAGEHVTEAAEIATQHLKEGLEATTIFFSAVSDKFLEMIAD